MGRLAQWTCRCMGVSLVAVLLGAGMVQAAPDLYTPTPIPEQIVGAETRAREHPQDYEASLQLAEAYREGGRLDDAERELKRAETVPVKAGDHSMVRHYRADVLLARGKVDDAIAELRAGAGEARFSLNAVNLWLRLSQVIRFYYRAGLDDACKHIISSGCYYSGGPLGPPAEAVLGLAERPRAPDSEDTARWAAVGALTTCIDNAMGADLASAVEAIPPDSPAAGAGSRALCAYHKRVGDLDQAVEDGQRAVKLDPDNWTGHWLLAERLEDQKRTDDATEQYREMARAAGNLLDIAAMAHDRLSHIRENTGRLDQAFEEYKSAIFLPEGRWQPTRAAALALRAHKAREALAFLADNRPELLLTLDPGEGLELMPAALAVLCAAVGDQEGMVRNWDDFLAVPGNNDEWLLDLREAMVAAPEPAGRDLFLATLGPELGLGDEALAHLEEALKVAPDLPAANMKLAEFLADRDPARASELAAKALEKAAPGSVIAQRAKRVLDRLQGKQQGAPNPPPAAPGG